MAQVEIISGRDRRREWTREQKEAILAEAFAPGVNVRAFSRRVDITAGSAPIAPPPMPRLR